jgi:UDP-N-acetylmuramate: L-alanyl-gamma-D-glutamyl-meso-diaminopimelate ligase
MHHRLNRIPDSVKTIHLIAVCGTGMGALACMLKDLGYQVSGSDQKVYPPMSHFLAGKGIQIIDGFRTENLSYGPDLVVVGNAVTRDNPEVVGMFQSGIPYCSMPQALNRFVAAGKKTLLVSGTHGKTTTSSILAWLLFNAGLDPTFMIGGILKNFDSNYHLGSGQYFVVEGDEYDTAFFDKGPKFMHYDPLIAVLTSVEFDHADIFSDLDHVLNTFDRFLSGLDSQSTLIAHNGDENVARMLDERSFQIERYGPANTADWRLGDISKNPPWTVFQVFKKDRIFATFKTQLYGAYNLLNALASIAVADRLMIPVATISSGLETFKGIRRRQEIRGQKRQITIIDDFAHHPTAVRETIQAVRSAFSNGKLIAVFEPRTNTSMRKVFQDVYPGAFEQADLICIRRPPLLEKIAVAERFSSEKLVDDLKSKGHDARFFADTDSIIDFLVQVAIPGDTILIMSNGGFDNIHERLLARL